MGSVGCIKSEILTTFKPRCQNWLKTSGQVEGQIESFHHNSLWQNQPRTLAHHCFGDTANFHLETSVSGAFSEFLNIVKIRQKFFERTSIETLQLVV